MTAIDSDLMLMPAADLISLWEELRLQRPTPFRGEVFRALERRVKEAGRLECPKLEIVYRWSTGAGSVDRWKMSPGALASRRRQERLDAQRVAERAARASRRKATA